MATTPAAAGASDPLVAAPAAAPRAEGQTLPAHGGVPGSLATLPLAPSAKYVVTLHEADDSVAATYTLAVTQSAIDAEGKVVKHSTEDDYAAERAARKEAQKHGHSHDVRARPRSRHLCLHRIGHSGHDAAHAWPPSP